MNKGILVTIIVGVLAATGAFVVLSGDEQTEDTTVNQQASQSTSQEVSQNDADEAQPASELSGDGAYVSYSDTALADAEGTERVLFFHAEWCSVCNYHEGQIEQSGVPEGITVIKADYDTEDALKEQYGVTVQSTFVWLNDDGSAKQSWPFANGLRTPQDLFDIVQS
jgi:thiol-disulfide isomerase/thioredoxin